MFCVGNFREEKLEKVAPFADDKWRNYKAEMKMPNILFGNLLPAKKFPEHIEDPESDPLKTEDGKGNGNSPSSESQISDITMVSTNDDFIMVELVNCLLRCMLIHF